MADLTGADVRKAIVETLQIVPGIGRVHDRERFVKDHGGLVKLYQPDGKEVRGGFVRRTSYQRLSFSTMTDEISEDWTIRLFRSFIDEQESELAFERICDAVSEVVLWGVALDRLIQPARPNEPRGPQLQVSEPVMFCGVLCHAATFTLTTKRKVAKDRMGVDLDAMRASEAALIPHPDDLAEACIVWPAKAGRTEDSIIFEGQS